MLTVVIDVDSGHSYIGSLHLLLGLLREGEGVAARVLEKKEIRQIMKEKDEAVRSHVFEKVVTFFMISMPLQWWLRFRS